jgi:hypothetical protein
MTSEHTFPAALPSVVTRVYATGGASARLVVMSNWPPIGSPSAAPGETGAYPDSNGDTHTAVGTPATAALGPLLDTAGAAW